VRISGSGIENIPYTFVDRPKTSLRVLALLGCAVTGFLTYKAVVEPPPVSWAVWAAFGMFAVCCYSAIHEFMLRPTRVTTIHPLERQVVVQETARWRRKELVASIPPGACFEIFPCDNDNSDAYGVRVKSTEGGWLTAAEYVSKDTAEYLTREANYRLFGW
jgi:hypothetical protein